MGFDIIIAGNQQSEVGTSCCVWWLIYIFSQDGKKTSNWTRSEDAPNLAEMKFRFSQVVELPTRVCNDKSSLAWQKMLPWMLGYRVREKPQIRACRKGSHFELGWFISDNCQYEPRDPMGKRRRKRWNKTLYRVRFGRRINVFVEHGGVRFLTLKREKIVR